MATCGTCGGDGKCRTCWGDGFIWKNGQQAECNPNCGTCGGDGKVNEPTGRPGDGRQSPGGGKGGKGGK